jgi:hypothetical protein
MITGLTNHFILKLPYDSLILTKKCAIKLKIYALKNRREIFALKKNAARGVNRFA